MDETVSAGGPPARPVGTRFPTQPRLTFAGCVTSCSRLDALLLAPAKPVLEHA